MRGVCGKQGDAVGDPVTAIASGDGDDEEDQATAVGVGYYASSRIVVLAPGWEISLVQKFRDAVFSRSTGLVVMRSSAIGSDDPRKDCLVLVATLAPDGEKLFLINREDTTSGTENISYITGGALFEHWLAANEYCSFSLDYTCLCLGQSHHDR